MFEVDKYMHKPFIEREPPCGPHFHEKPRYTMTEQVEHTARLMRETIDRLLRFEERLKTEVADMSKNITSDNVIFKNALHEAWQTFLMEVKNEINVFEGNIEADLRLFKSDTDTNFAQQLEALSTSIRVQYEALADTVNARIDANNGVQSDALADFQRKLTTELNTFYQTITADVTSFKESVSGTNETFRETWGQVIHERLTAQDAKISDAEMYMKGNLEAVATTLLGDMHANGDFADILAGEVFNDLQRKADGLGHISIEYFGGVGDGETDNAPFIALAIAHSNVTGRAIYFPDGVYLVDSDISFADNITLKGSRNAIIKRKANSLDKYNIFNIDGVQNVTIEGLTIKGDRYEHTGETGQHGCGINISKSQYVTIRGCRIIECWGDGVTIGGNEDNVTSFVNVDQCIVEYNRRNGISVIGGVCNSRINNCDIINNGGTAPSLGIDFEPWVPTLTNENVTVKGCRFAENTNGALTVFEYNNAIRVVDNEINGNLSVKLNTDYINVEAAHPTNIVIANNYIAATCYIYRCVYSSLIITGNTFDAGRVMMESSVNITEGEAKSAKAKIIHGNVFNRSALPVSIGANANVIVSDNIADECQGSFFDAYNAFNIVVKNNIVNGYNTLNHLNHYVFRLNGVVKNIDIANNTVNPSPNTNSVAVMFSIGGGSANACRVHDNNVINALFSRLVQFGAWNDNIVYGNVGPSQLGAAEGLPVARAEFVGTVVSFLNSGEEIPVPMMCVHTGTGYAWKAVATT